MPNAQTKVNVSFKFEVTNPDGSPYHSTVLNYADLPYAVLVQMEKILVAALAEANKIGEAIAAKT